MEDIPKLENTSEPLEPTMFGKSKADLEENILDSGVQEVPK